MQGPVVVLGCSGAIGQRITSMALESGQEVHGFKGNNPCNFNSNFHKCKNINLLTDSIYDDLKKIQARTLIHSAWITKPGDYLNSPENQIWINKSEELIEAFFEFGGENLLVTGTCAEYSWEGQNNLKEDSDNEFPNSIYGQSKLALLDWLRFSGYPFLWTRTFFQYGEKNDSERLIPYLLNSLIESEKCIIRGANEVRDFVFIDDVANAMFSLINTGAEGVVNIGSGQGILLENLAALMSRIIGKTNLIQLDYIEEPRIVVSDQNRFNSFLPDFQFRSIESGLQEMANYRRNNLRDKTKSNGSGND